MKTILFILPDLNQGGAEKIITTICNEMDRSRFIPKLVLFKKEGYFLKDLKEGIEVIELNISRIRFAVFKVLPLIHRLKPAIVFSGWGEISAFLAPFIPLFPKTKFISRETNVVSKHVTRKEILFFYRFYNRYHQVIAQSDDMKNDLIENFNITPKKITKINNPVDFEVIDQKLKQNISLPFDSNQKNVVAVGNLTSRKGFDLLLQVFTHLRTESIQLYVLGDGRDKEKLMQMKADLALEYVHFLGNQTNPYPFLQQADLFILSSRYEGFPNVLLEAGACGTYSLANDCPGGIREIVVEGLNGEIHDIKNAENFADHIKKALNRDYDVAKIRQNIYERFNKSQIIHQYEKIFEEL